MNGQSLLAVVHASTAYTPKCLVQRFAQMGRVCPDHRGFTGPKAGVNFRRWKRVSAELARELRLQNCQIHEEQQPVP